MRALPKLTKRTYHFIQKQAYYTTKGFKELFYAEVKGNRSHSFSTEREAAIQADIMLIKSGEFPVNILKPVKA